MFIGGGMGGIWNTAREEALFYQGYGKRDINQAALAYYRYERLVSDMAEFCQQILRTTTGGADRERSLEKYYSIFLPNQTLELAHQTDTDLNGG
jgi:spectinomycin phosphotransferase